jgi:16S rRNA (cytosine1402-N4)-methyltransferase
LTMYHEPVLLGEVMGFWLTQNPGTYVDCTTGGGGHSAAMLAQLQPGSTIHCLDRDDDALAHASKILTSNIVNVVFHHKAFAELASCVAPASINGILYDLGVSSHQLDERSRGFTLNGSSQALDLRMDRRESLDAQEWIRATEVDDMAHIFRANADMDRAHPLARKIKEQLLVADEEATTFNVSHLRAAVDSVFRDRRFDQNSLMARVLQAIRMDINQEMPQVEQSLRAAVEALLPGGHLCVISYHSVEDRMVKVTMAEFEQDCICPPRSPMCMCGGNRRKVRKLLRKPGLPTEEEIKRNPRARSAKLRVYERV